MSEEILDKQSEELEAVAESSDEEITEDRKVATSQAKCANTTQHRPSRPTHPITLQRFSSPGYIWWHSKFKGIFLLSKYYIL